ncbi:unnamed protein product, partial [Musa acuminata subsp. malaccensis]
IHYKHVTKETRTKVTTKNIEHCFFLSFLFFFFFFFFFFCCFFFFASGGNQPVGCSQPTIFLACHARLLPLLH